MCMAIPSRIIALDGEMATVEAFGRTRTVSLMLMPEPVGIGDYLLIQAGNFASERVDHERALETLAILGEIVDHAEN
ncbi:hydrogenase assembly protein HupF [Noviherbaspirillum denitrificans]|uniref:Hydrogenase assembly protein HupF n=2 Tax=Noviherbaspirillum denitrificans TaxID=1968433 RepID=A0A254T969_9BURK|nr:hydrogenase assembly protein HupF [Noviherbaspirillum denitrificans]